MSWRKGDIKGSWARHAGERVENLLMDGTQWTIERMARTAKCTYWTARKHLLRLVIEGKAVRHLADTTGRSGPAGLIYERKANGAGT